MDLKQFVRFAGSDPAISKFLKGISEDLEKKNVSAPRVSGSVEALPGWLYILILMLWQSMPWIRMGWKWMTIKRLQLDPQLETYVQGLGMKQDLAKKVVATFMDELTTSSRNKKLKESLMSVMDQVDIVKDKRA